jgi:arsenite methyltransferase
VRRHDDAVMHPLPLASSRHYFSTAKIREVPGDLWLRLAKDFDKVADTDFLLSHEVQETQASVVAQSLKEAFQAESLLRHAPNIFALTDVRQHPYIRIHGCEEDSMPKGTLSEKCCAVAGGSTETATSLLNSVKSKYGSVADSSLSTDHDGVRAVAEAFGYTTEELTSIPAAANMGLSCGNPTATARLRRGEVVVDLGSGGGLDVFLASKLVGAEGRVIGIDITPEMIERARANAESGGYKNVEFHLANIDQLPLADASVDCVISNCVINLAPDKPAVFREIARVLKPGGRLAVSDIALKGELPEAIASSLAAYVGCISGAIAIDIYRRELLKAGFEFVEIVESGSDLNAYAKVENQSGCCSPAMASGLRETTALHQDLSSLLSAYDVNQAAASVKVYALKSAAAVAEPCCGPTCCS